MYNSHEGKKWRKKLAFQPLLQIHHHEGRQDRRLGGDIQLAQVEPYADRASFNGKSSDDAQNQTPFNHAFFYGVLFLPGRPGDLHRHILINLIHGDQPIFICIGCAA